MILLVTSSLRAEECATALRGATGEEVVLAESLRRAASLLRAESFLGVVLDQYLLETEPDETETVMEHLGSAIPLQVNLAIMGIDRLVREVRAGMQRRHREEAIARQAAMNTLQNELNGTLTALLLSCEMAIKVPGVPSEASEKLASAHKLVQDLRAQLESHHQT